MKSLLYPTGELWIRSKRKRFSDLCMLACLFPAVSLITIFAVSATLFRKKHELFYIQRRVGQDGKLFTVHKFKTMVDGKLTCVGRLLNVLGADETPQLLYDIPRGVMGLIGARALIPADFVKMQKLLGKRNYTRWRQAYTACRPGWMSAFSQPSRKYVAQSKEYLMARYRYDTGYLKNASLHRDIIILLRSLAMWCTNVPALLTATKESWKCNIKMCNSCKELRNRNESHKKTIAL